MKTWKNRNRRSKKHKQRGGVKLTPEQKIQYTGIRNEVNRKLKEISPEDNSDSAMHLRSTLSLLNQFLTPMFDVNTGLIKDNSSTLGDVDSRYELYKIQKIAYNAEHGINPASAAPAPAPAAPAPAAPAPAAPAADAPPPAPAAPAADAPAAAAAAADAAAPAPAPAAAAPAPAAPVGTPVWPMAAPAAREGQPTSISDCSKMLAEARAEIAALRGSLAEDAARMAAQNEALQRQLDGLRLDIDGKRAEVAAARAATAALSGEKGAIRTELARIQQTLQETLGELADTSALNDTLTNALTAAGANKDAALKTLRDQLEGLRLSSAAEIAAKEEEIRTLNAAHAEQLAETRRRYEDEATALRRNLDRIQGEGGRLTAAQQRQIEDLEGQLTALRRQIEELGQQLRASEAATAKEAREKTDAARAASAAAAAEAAKLDAVTREREGLRGRLAAAEAAAGAAEAARAAAVAAQGASADAAAAANRQVADAAAAAEAARAAAVSDAAARALEAGAAAAAAAAATVERDAIQASLDALKNSVPTIVSITGGTGDLVGRVGGRDAVYDEPLTVTWNIGAAPSRDTWVFVMFAAPAAGVGKKVPVYSQLLLNADPFTFTSTLSGPVQAVIYDVVSHNRGDGVDKIDF